MLSFLFCFFWHKQQNYSELCFIWDCASCQNLPKLFGFSRKLWGRDQSPKLVSRKKSVSVLSSGRSHKPPEWRTQGRVPCSFSLSLETLRVHRQYHCAYCRNDTDIFSSALVRSLWIHALTVVKYTSTLAFLKYHSLGNKATIKC